jgi:hypothetical protein
VCSSDLAFFFATAFFVLMGVLVSSCVGLMPISSNMGAAAWNVGQALCAAKSRFATARENQRFRREKSLQSRGGASGMAWGIHRA